MAGEDGKGFELNPDEVKRASLRLDEASEYLGEHGLKQKNLAAQAYGLSDMGRLLNAEHKRVFKLIGGGLNDVVTNLTKFSHNIQGAATRAIETDQDAGAFIKALANTPVLHFPTPYVVDPPGANPANGNPANGNPANGNPGGKK